MKLLDDIEGTYTSFHTKTMLGSHNSKITVAEHSKVLFPTNFHYGIQQNMIVHPVFGDAKERHAVHTRKMF